MVELCLICRKRMWVGEEFRISASGITVGYVHKRCLYRKQPKVKTVKS